MRGGVTRMLMRGYHMREGVMKRCVVRGWQQDLSLDDALLDDVSLQDVLEEDVLG